ncbi:hypothetical protein H9X90_06580 [Faecalicatena contorta]|uniref:hypothetical protein n=1 Tax=Faecalicatena contorta TaxID=39482 RepID=UPI00195F2A79|nr:hypothetical protein [Faecalicatena contorta]MBM6685784.1 hypothetical protein [Faecalicatena contorta]MBM6710398.1 hypothetical protein [Faecalicatena contorta]
MGRKIAAQFLLLVLLLAALYGQQETFAQEDRQETYEESQETYEDGKQTYEEREETDSGDEGEEQHEQPKGDREQSGEGGENPGEEQTDQPQKGEDGDGQKEDPPVPYEITYGEPDGEDQYYTVKPQVTILHQGETGETVYSLENASGVSAGGRISQPDGQAVVEPEAFGEGENHLRVWIEYTPPGEELRILYEKEFLFKIDTCPPALDMWVEGGEDWHQYQANVRYKTRESSDGSGIKYIVCYINGQQQERTEKSEGAFSVRQASRGGQGIPVAVAAVDQAGNRTYRESQVYVDDAPPAVEIRGVQDYMITSRDVQALFEASDDNGLASCSVHTIWISPEGASTVLEEGEWRDENGSSKLSQIFSQDGIYRMRIRAVDRAGFQSETETQVIVDKQNPVIAYVDEIDGTWVKEFCWDRPVSEIFTDFTSYTYRLTLDGVPYLPGQTVKKEGRRILEAEAVDAAGNRSRAAAEFVIDHTPPKIVFEGVENGVAYEERRTCTVRLGNSADWIKEIRVNGERQSLAPGTDEYTCTFEEYQVHSIRVTAVDKAGNEKKDSVVFQVVPRQSLAGRLLSPVRQSLGLEKDGFKQHEDGTGAAVEGREEESGAMPAVTVAVLLLIFLVLLLPGFALYRRIAKRKGV